MMTMQWKAYPNLLRDEELVRLVTSDLASTPLERNLALRLDRLLYHCDDAEDDGPWRQVQLELF